MVTNATEMSKKYSKQPEGSPLDLLEKKLEKIMQDSHGITPPFWKFDELLSEDHAVHAICLLKSLGYDLIATPVYDNMSMLEGWELEWSTKKREELIWLVGRVKNQKFDLKKQLNKDDSTQK